MNCQSFLGSSAPWSALGQALQWGQKRKNRQAGKIVAAMVLLIFKPRNIQKYAKICPVALSPSPVHHSAPFTCWLFLFHPFSPLVQSLVQGYSFNLKFKSVLSFLNELNTICCQTKLDDIAHERAIICRQLYAGHMIMSSQPMKRKKNLQRMVTTINY